MSTTADKLSRMRELVAGWNGYDAPPPSSWAIETAERFVEMFPKPLEINRLAPSAIGGVGLTRELHGRKVYVEFYNQGYIYALFSDGQTEPDSYKVDDDEQSMQSLIHTMRAYMGD